ncbi:unnamed protein product [Paramecium sonneborni]|uniref:Uncharacterized protein n=1 Tax=Paramecium sonneborni TaxID=65129 RepID=A0A8S1RCH3_9CILI|nr:unnamed protein product [Paramecium sonneborni]
MIALKRQQFRAKQRQIVLNKLFQQNRMSSLLVFKLDKLEQILTQQHYDSLEYQESIQQIINMSHNVNLSQLYHLLVQNFIDTIQYQMDVGYYVLSVQMEMAQQPILIKLIQDIGIQQFLAFNDPMTLQFLELFLIQVPNLNDIEADLIFNELQKWSQSINLTYVISALSCLNLLIKSKQELLSPDLSISILQLLNTEYSQLAFEILQFSNWQYFHEEQLIVVWDYICKQLLNCNNEEICISILKSITKYHYPYQLKEICQYLSMANDYYCFKVIEMLSQTQINRNFDQITSELLDQICYRVIKNQTLVPFLKSFLIKNKLLYESYNFPLQIEYLLQ